MLRVVGAITSAPWLMPARYLRALHAIACRDPASVPEDIRARYEARQRGEGPLAIVTNAGERLAGTRSVAYRDGVAVVPIIGPIFRYADFFTDVSGALTLDDLAGDFAAAIANAKVRDVVLYIDSPGGEANGIHEFANIVRLAADTSGKRVIAYIAGIGASAAYWIASACGEIVVDRTAMAPCIGVVFAVPDPTGEKDYIEIVSTQSPKKRLDITTEDGRQQMQKWADELAAIFILCVASNREVSEDVVTSPAWGEGSLEIGAALVAAGVADRLGSFEELVNELISVRGAGISLQGNPPQNKEKQMRKSKAQLAARAGEEPPDTPDTPEDDIEVETETPATPETVTVATAAAAARIPARGAESDEMTRLRAQVALLQRTNVETSAGALIAAAVRDLKMPPLPVITDGKPAAETLSSLLLGSLVDSKMNDGCATCQANHERTAKVIALLPPAAPAGRLAIKPVKEAASIISGPSTTVEQADLHIAVTERLAADGLRPGTKAYARGYGKHHREMSTAAANAAA